MQRIPRKKSPKLTAAIVEGLVRTCFAKNFDAATDIPHLHKEMWEYACRDNPYVALIAPRGHAKSTAITHSYTLSEILFRGSNYIIIVSDTEGQACQFLADIKKELLDNDDVRELFGSFKVYKDNESDFIAEFEDGAKFRIQAKGAEQKLRGLKWDNKRPNLIVIDDLENDEAVMTKERREKLKRWFYGALVPCLSPSGKIRYVGTILHMDSLLENIFSERPFHISKCKIEETDLKISKQWPQRSNWLVAKYKAHNEDFSQILWPQRFDQEFFVGKRNSFRAQGLPDLYSQEYLNIPIDESVAFFRRSDFKAMTEEDFKKRKNFYVACDLAISEKQTADYSVWVVGGMDETGMLYIVDVLRERCDGREIVNNIISMQRAYKPEIFTIEQGAIEKSIGAYLREEMLKTNTYININVMRPDKDKLIRARSVQARMRAGAIKFDKDAEWYEAFERELLEFPRSKNDDQVDSFAWLGLTLDLMQEALTDEEKYEEDYELEIAEIYEPAGQSSYTGY